jgi:HK97 family phage major capsid protein
MTTAKAADIPSKLPMQHRFEALEITPHRTRAVDGIEGPVEENAYDITISSENPVSRYSYLEVLGHAAGEVDLTFAQNGISFMLEHGGVMQSCSPDPDYHLGLITELAVSSRKLVGVARFAGDDALSDIALRVKRDWASGSPTRPFISAGWVPVARKITEPTKDGETTTVRYTKWQIREASNVAIPADPAGAKARSGSLEEFVIADELDTTQHRSQEAPKMEPTTTTTTPSAPAAAPPAGSVAVGEDRLKARSDEAAQIVSLCVAQNCASRAAEFISGGLTLAEVKTRLFDELTAKSRSTTVGAPPAEALDGLTRKERKIYSYRNAAMLALRSRSGMRNEKCLELDVHEEMVKLAPREYQQRGGILVPFDTRSEQEIMDAWEQKQLRTRAMDTKTAGKGLEWVGQQTMPLVEALVAIAVMPRLGANFNTGLTNMLSYPRETGLPTVSFIGETPASGQTLTDSSTGEILSGPKQMIGGVKMSRQWLFQTQGAGEARVRNALVGGTARALDRNGFTGLGHSSQPTGLYFLTGVNSTAMSSIAPTMAKIVDMGGKISDQNADVGRMGWATTSLLAWFLRSKLEFTSAGSNPIWTGPIQDGLIAGYRAIGSTQMSKALGAGADEHGFIFGNWEFCDVNLWGGTELVVDELSAGDAAQVIIRSYGMGDVVFTHPEAFSIGTAAKPA